MVSICIWSSRLDKIQNDRKFFHDARSFLKWKVMKKKLQMSLEFYLTGILQMKQ